MSESTGISSALTDRKRRSALAEFFTRLVKEKPLGTVTGIIILILIFASIFAGVVAPYDYSRIVLEEILEGPSFRHLLGTDSLGRDFLSRLIHAGRVSILVGLTVTTLSVIGSAVIGATSGFFGGKFDLIVQRWVDAYTAYPGLILLITLMSIVGRGLIQVILVLGLTGAVGGGRGIRSWVIAIKESDYVLASEAVGNTRFRTLFRHILPNVTPLIIIGFSMSIGGVIMSLASLGFLGYGLPADVPDWGGMLSREGRQYMEQAPRLALLPGLALTIVVYSLNMFGDAMRDLLDPRMRGA